MTYILDVYNIILRSIFLLLDKNLIVNLESYDLLKIIREAPKKKS